MKEIRILNQTLSERFWEVKTTTYRTGHMYSGSVFETSDDCGNCDGAKCNSCKLVSYTECEFSVPCNILKEMLIKSGLPAEYYSDITDDYHFGRTSDGEYHLCWPTASELETHYPEFYKKITTLEPWVKEAINSYPLKPNTCWCDIRKAILKSRNYPFEENGCAMFESEVSDAHLHTSRQLDLWWTAHRNSFDDWKYEKLLSEKSKNLVWNYECFRDFCGSITEDSINGRLARKLPEAINKFIESETQREEVYKKQYANSAFNKKWIMPKTFDTDKNELINNCLINVADDEWVDYRTKINVKKVMLKTLLLGIQPTRKELIAWLDVIYNNSLPVGVELFACR